MQEIKRITKLGNVQPYSTDVDSGLCQCKKFVHSDLQPNP